MEFELFSSSFCGACRQTRAVLEQAARRLPGSRISEHDVAFEPERAEGENIVATPTVIVRSPAGAEALRATGVPTIAQVLDAAARAASL
ncbi:thioredoxin family protein [Leucobacter weissii]|uniref:Thioredoxin family protein n=1 Tax=Leucobacter weissii TaxID=1983706 RepID=A0A939SCJ6_9MICO|nr:thioredoxin family protein [Leucobacter weissii]